MKKRLFTLSATVLLLTTAEAQNVGIGTNVPNTPLHVVTPNFSDGSNKASIRIQPIGRGGSSTSNYALIDFWSTFDNFAGDQGPRRTASIKAGYTHSGTNPGTWGNEFLSFHVGQATDAANEPTERMRIAGNGYVGIGTSVPTAVLDINGSLRIRTLASGFVKSDGSGNLSVSSIAAGDLPSGSGNYIQNGTALQTANFNISGNGYVGNAFGVGTTNPGQMLDVQGGASFGAGAYQSGAVVNIGSSTVDYPGNSGWAGTYNTNLLLTGKDYTTISFHDAGNKVNELGHIANSFFFDGGQSWGPVSLGINTRAPGGTLDVSSNLQDAMYVRSSAPEADIDFEAPSGGWQVGTNAGGNGSGGNQFFIYDNGTSGYVATFQRGTRRVGIGTASPAYTLDVNGSIYGYDVRAKTGKFYSDQRTNFCLALQSDRNLVLYDNGYAAWNAGSQISDIRTKTNIVPLEDVLPTLMKLSTIRFNYKPELDLGNEQHIGVIAQEILKYYPDMIYHDVKGDRYLVHYDKLTTLLLKAIQEQQAMISKIETRLSALEKAGKEQLSSAAK